MAMCKRDIRKSSNSILYQTFAFFLLGSSAISMGSTAFSLSESLSDSPPENKRPIPTSSPGSSEQSTCQNLCILTQCTSLVTVTWSLSLYLVTVTWSLSLYLVTVTWSLTLWTDFDILVTNLFTIQEQKVWLVCKSQMLFSSIFFISSFLLSDFTLGILRDWLKNNKTVTRKVAKLLLGLTLKFALKLTVLML